MGRGGGGGEGAPPASGAVTDEPRSPRPNSAQPFGRRFFSAPAALLAPYRSTGGICSSLAPCRGRKLLAANVTGFTLMTTKTDMQEGNTVPKAFVTQSISQPHQPLKNNERAHA